MSCCPLQRLAERLSNAGHGLSDRPGCRCRNRSKRAPVWCHAHIARHRLPGHCQNRSCPYGCGRGNAARGRCRPRWDRCRDRCIGPAGAGTWNSAARCLWGQRSCRYPNRSSRFAAVAAVAAAASYSAARSRWDRCLGHCRNPNSRCALRSFGRWRWDRHSALGRNQSSRSGMRRPWRGRSRQGSLSY